MNIFGDIACLLGVYPDKSFNVFSKDGTLLGKGVISTKGFKYSQQNNTISKIQIPYKTEDERAFEGILKGDLIVVSDY